jgi:hypothetical protein
VFRETQDPGGPLLGAIVASPLHARQAVSVNGGNAKRHEQVRLERVPSWVFTVVREVTVERLVVAFFSSLGCLPEARCASRG